MITGDQPGSAAAEPCAETNAMAENETMMITRVRMRVRMRVGEVMVRGLLLGLEM